MYIKRIQAVANGNSDYYYEFDMHSQPLGEGGMGVVYKGYKVNCATESRSVVAIKVLHDGLSEELYERAYREASIRLKNNNLIEMIDFISENSRDTFGTPVRRYYIVSEYLNGLELSDILAGRFRDRDGIEIVSAKKLYMEYITDREGTSVKIIKSVLSGILALHDNGYIHRDIDPSNIMVTDEGDIKLIDFGIAKNISSLGTIDNLQEDGKFIGKAEYAAPELVNGNISSQGYQTDIYAIGILFYRLLTGELPFKGTQFEIIQQQLSKRVPVKKIHQSSYAQIVKKATQKRIGDRYVSVAEMRFEIDKAGDNRIWIVKNWKVLTASLIAVAACIILVMYLPQPDPIDPRVQRYNNALAQINSSSAKTQSVGWSEMRILADEGFDKAIKKIDESNETLLNSYNRALAKLNSTKADSVISGWEEMKNLADKHYPKALMEVGITYCPYPKAQTSTTSQRRKYLTNLLSQVGMEEQQSIAAINNLRESKINDAHVLYILGHCYWQGGEWQKAKSAFDNASIRISHIPSSTDSIGGFKKEELVKLINRYKRECEKELKQR